MKAPTTHTVKFKVAIGKETPIKYVRNGLRYLVRLTDAFAVPVWNMREVVAVSDNELYIQMSSTRATMLLVDFLKKNQDKTDIKTCDVVGSKIVLKFTTPRKKKEEPKVDLSGMTLTQIQEMVDSLTKENNELRDRLNQISEIAKV